MKKQKQEPVRMHRLLLYFPLPGVKAQSPSTMR